MSRVGFGPIYNPIHVGACPFWLYTYHAGTTAYRTALQLPIIYKFLHSIHSESLIMLLYSPEELSWKKCACRIPRILGFYQVVPFRPSGPSDLGQRRALLTVNVLAISSGVDFQETEEQSLLRLFVGHGWFTVL